MLPQAGGIANRESRGNRKKWEGVTQRNEGLLLGKSYCVTLRAEAFSFRHFIWAKEG